MNTARAYRAYFLAVVADLLRDDVLVGQAREPRVLDIGVGTGFLGSLLAGRFSYAGYDTLPAALEEADTSDIIFASDALFRPLDDAQRDKVMANIAAVMAPSSVLVFAVARSRRRNVYEDLFPQYGLRFVDEGLAVHETAAFTENEFYRDSVHFVRKV